MSKIFEFALQINGSSAGSLGKTIADAKSQIKMLDGSMKELQSKKDAVERFAGLKKETSELEKRFQEASKRSEELAKQIKNTENPSKELQVAFSKSKKEAAGLKTQFDKNSEALQKVRGELQKAGISTKNLAKESLKLKSELSSLEQKKSVFANIAEAASKGQQKIKASTSEMSQNFGKLKTDATRYVFGITAAMVGVGGSAYLMSKQTAEAGDKIAKSSAALGMNTIAYQELRYALGMAGIEGEAFDGVLKTQKANLDRGSEGFGRAKKVMDQYGISLDELSGMGTEQAFIKMYTELGKVEDQGKRTTLAMALWGEKGLDIAADATKGVGNLEELRAEARKIGIIIDEQTASNAEAFLDAESKMKQSMTALKYQLGGSLLPAFTDGFHKMTDVIVQHQGQFAEFATKFSSGASEVLPKVLELAQGFSQTAITGGQLINTAAQMVGGFDNLGIVIGVAFGAKSIMSAIDFGKSMFQVGKDTYEVTKSMIKAAKGTDLLRIKSLAMATAQKAVTAAQWALNLALNANPVGLVILGIAALIAIGVALYKNWDQITAYLGGLWASFKEKFPAIAAVVEGAVDTIKGVWNALPGSISAALSGVSEFIMAPFRPAFEWVTNKLEWMGKKWQDTKNLIAGGGSGGGAGDGSAPSISANAKGGIYDKGAFLTTFAEEGPEAAIPLNNTARARSLLEKTNSIMGFTSGGGSQFIYSPTVQVSGDDSDLEAKILRLLEQQWDKFKRQMQQSEHNKKRTSFA